MGYSHTHSFTYCLCLLSCFHCTVEYVWQKSYSLPSLKFYLLFTENVCWPLLEFSLCVEFSSLVICPANYSISDSPKVWSQSLWLLVFVWVPLPQIIAWKRLHAVSWDNLGLTSFASFPLGITGLHWLAVQIWKTIDSYTFFSCLVWGMVYLVLIIIKLSYRRNSIMFWDSFMLCISEISFYCCVLFDLFKYMSLFSSSLADEHLSCL